MPVYISQDWGMPVGGTAPPSASLQAALGVEPAPGRAQIGAGHDEGRGCFLGGRPGIRYRGYLWQAWYKVQRAPAALPSPYSPFLFFAARASAVTWAATQHMWHGARGLGKPAGGKQVADSTARTSGVSFLRSSL